MRNSLIYLIVNYAMMAIAASKDGFRNVNALALQIFWLLITSQLITTLIR